MNYTDSNRTQKTYPDQHQDLVVLLQLLGDLEVGLTHQNTQLKPLQHTVRALLHSLTGVEHGQIPHFSKDQRRILPLLQVWSFLRLT